MTIDLVFPVLPPALDGIGDHTARLAEALSDRASVRVLTAQAEAAPIPGATVEPAFSCPPRRGVLALADAVAADPPDWLFLQFNQFSYGRWGLNPFLPAALYRIQRRCPGTRLAVLFHEDFLPASSWRNALMTTWQRAQFWALGRLADQVFFSIEPWVRQYRSWFPETPVDHLPIGSNIPRVEAERDAVRRRLGISEETFVLGVFGSLHASRLLPHIRAADDAVRRETGNALLLYVGPDGEDVRRAMDGRAVLDAGRLPARAVSRHVQAMDVYLAPFVDGVSTRRGSFLVALQHGVPTVGTHGPLTDPMLSDQDGEAFVLAPADEPDAFGRAAAALYRAPRRRSEMGRAAQHLFESNFEWDTIADRALRVLTTHNRPPVSA
ncbi:MAG: glycosyltransferase family 4 protein [Salinibacter sp.]|uniref:glycosyltransferase family 4 protein n=1 Tax=Salinibacter sp. TaxID=2065818 RepID=UPI0035D50C3F